MNQPSLLNTIAENEEREVVDLPRLTTSGVFLTHQRIVAALTRAVNACRTLPDMPPKEVNDQLLEMAKQCGIASEAAMRLHKANQ